VMCPADDSHLTLEFHDHFVIKPTITFTSAADFAVNNIGETGAPVPTGFEYSSGNNKEVLHADGLKKLIELGAQP
jgi:UDP-N-acetylglucosamine 4,6-dehydratase